MEQRGLDAIKLLLVAALGKVWYFFARDIRAKVAQRHSKADACLYCKGRICFTTQTFWLSLVYADSCSQLDG